MCSTYVFFAFQHQINRFSFAGSGAQLFKSLKSGEDDNGNEDEVIIAIDASQNNRFKPSILNKNYYVFSIFSHFLT